MKLIFSLAAALFVIFPSLSSFAQNSPPKKCYPPECAAPRPGCHYEGGPTIVNGCPMGCGHQVCNPPPPPKPICTVQNVILDSAEGVQFSLNPQQSIPAVSHVSLDRARGCGTVPVGHGSGSCPTEIQLSFVAATSGLCESFGARVDQVRSNNIITIIKSRMANCTRPEHAPQDAPLSLGLQQDLPDGNFIISNPVEVKDHLRP